jgi:hypothetical protein
MALSVFVISGHLVVGGTPTTGPDWAVGAGHLWAKSELMHRSKNALAH